MPPFTALLDTMVLSLDRTVFATSITVFLFLLTHLLVASKWAGRVSKSVEIATEQLKAISDDIHNIKIVIARQMVIEERTEHLSERVRVLESRVNM